MTEKIEVGDIRGDLVSVGDKIAYAVRQGNSAALRVGTITEVVMKHMPTAQKTMEKLPYKLRVRIDEYGTATSTLIEVRLKRFVKVGE